MHSESIDTEHRSHGDLLMRMRRRDARSSGCNDNSGSVWIFVCLLVHKGRGLTFTFACVLVRALVDGPGSQPTDAEEPLSMCSSCSRAHLGRVTTACVSSPKRRGSLHKLAHAAGHGHFLGASTSRRSDPSV